MNIKVRQTTLALIALGVAVIGTVSAPAQALAPSGGTITQITVSPTNESEANGNGRYGPVVSDDGRYVAFWTYSPSIVPGDDNGLSDVFVYDTTTRVTTLVSRSASGGVANGGSSEPRISANGKYLVFQSNANNLAGAAYDDEGVGDLVYRYHIASGRITLVSKTPKGAIPAEWASVAAVSANGRYVAYSSRAHDIVPGDHNKVADAFLYDATADATIKVSHGQDGLETDKASYASAVSGNGRYVAWQTNSTNLGPAHTYSALDAYVYDAQTDTSTLISHDSTGRSVGGQPTGISDNGKIVAFNSSSAVLSPGNTSKQSWAYVYSAATDTVKLISTPRAEWPAGVAAFAGSMSATGRYIAWTAVPLDDLEHPQVYLYDRQTKQSTAIAVAPDGSAPNGGSGDPSVSRSGNHVGFCSTATNLVPGDGYGNCDIFLWSRTAG